MKRTDSKFLNANLRQAREGRHREMIVTELLPSFEDGQKVELRNGQVTTVIRKTEAGDYLLEGYPGKFFPPNTLKPAQK